MSSICISNNEFAAFFGERLAFKSGLALTRGEIASRIKQVPTISDAILLTQSKILRLRADEIEDAFQIVLFALGVTEKPFVGHAPTILRFRYLRDPRSSEILEDVLEALGKFHFDKGKRTLMEGFNQNEFLNFVSASMPAGSAELALELIEMTRRSEEASPWEWFKAKTTDWVDTIELKDLFESESLTASYGNFIDQRFLDYLASNPDHLSEVNWRKFEALTAEYFSREGFEVAIGPGRNDDGIDIRVWTANADRSQPPLILVQCKREKRRIEKVVVKALWADVIDQRAASGLIVTTSSLAPGADAVRKSRSYPIHVADRTRVKQWLSIMRTPGKGIFLGE